MVEDKLLIDDMSMSDLLKDTPQGVAVGTVVTARVLGTNAEGVLIDIGLKREGLIPRQEFPDFEKLPFATGDSIPVLVRHVEQVEGYTKVSWRAARERTVWDKLISVHRDQTLIDGVMMRKVKGGYVVDIGIDAFLPASQWDTRPNREADASLGKTISVLITELDRAKSNIVVSRRRVLERERLKKRQETIATLAEGDIKTGTITGITKFGAFLDIGGIEGLLHISDIAWNRTEHLENKFKVGQTLQVKVLKYDTTNQRVSLGLKQLAEHPWARVLQKYAVGALVKGRVTSFTTFGAFVELEPGVEGLIHVSEFSWKDRMAKPQDYTQVGQEIEAKVILVDPSREKLSLSLKRLGSSPWELAKANHPTGSRIRGAVTHLTPFGAFVMLAEGIEGLIHISDLSWSQKVKHPSELLKVGQDVEVVIIDIKPDAEKIVLSLKHLQKDPLTALKTGKTVTGRVIRSSDGGVTVELPNGLEAFIRPQELSRDVEGKDIVPAVEEEITAKVVRVEPRERRVELSIRRYDREQESQMLARYAGKNQNPLTLGDILLDTSEPSDE